MATIGPKLQIDNFAEYKKNIDSLITQGKTLDSAMKLLESTWDKNTTAQDKAAGKAKILAQEIEAQKAKVAQIAEVVAKATEKYGADSEEVAKWTQAQNKAQTELNRMQHELNDCNDELNDQQKELQQSEKELKSLDKSTDEVTDSMEDAEKQTKSWGDVMKGSLAAEAIKAGFSKLVDLGKKFASAMWDATKAGMAYADEIETMSSVTGLATDTLQEYKYMADLVDVDLNTITGSLTKVTSSMKSAKKGSGDAYEAYKKLHVEYKNSNGTLRKSEDVFNDVLKALKGVHNETEREQLAMTLLGKSAKDLNPLIEADADEIAGLKKEAHDMGYVLSGRALQALNKAQDGMDRLGKVVEGAKNRLAVGMAPAVEKVADLLTNKLADPRVQKAINGLANLLGNILVGTVELLDKVTGGLIDTIGQLGYEIPEMSESMQELVDRTDTLRESSEALHSEYNDNARAILDERDRVTDLWKELQTLTAENGYVTDANKDRANYILGELNNALDTEYSMNGNIIEQYGTMKESVADVIEAKTALALLDAAQARYADARLNLDSNRRDIAEYGSSLHTMQLNKDSAERRRDAAIAERDKTSSLFNPGKWDKLNSAAQEYDAEYKALSKDIEELEGKLNEARALDQEYTATIATYGEAMTAAAANNNKKVIKILSAGLDAYVEYSERHGKITQDDIKQLRNDIATQKQIIEEYQNNMKAGLKGYDEAGLKKLTDDLDGMNRVLDATQKGAKTWEQAWSIASQNMSDSVTTSMDKASSATKTGTQGLIDAITDSIFPAREKGEEIGTAVTDGTSEAIDANTGTVAERLSAKFRSDFAPAANKAGEDVGTSAGEGVEEGLTYEVSKAGPPLQGTLTTILKGAKGTAETDGEKIGVSTAQGIKRGMNSMAAKVAGVAGSVMQTVLNAMKYVAKINSPSKVTAGFGMGLGEGLIKGMDKISPMVDLAAEKFMDSTLSAMRPATFSLPDPAAYGGTTYNQQRSIAPGAVTVQVHAAPGQSAESIADAVMDKINRAINSESAVWA